MVSMLNSTMLSLEMIGGLAKHTDHPREALGTISVIVMGCVEGFQGRVATRDIEGALLMLKAKLADNDGVPSMNLVEIFKAALQ